MKNTKESGFTLLEVMVTMLIVSIGLLATAQLLMVTIKENNKSEVRIDASSVVQSLLRESEARLLAAADPVAECAGLKVAMAAAANRQYLGSDYGETVTCTELGSGLQRFVIQATVVGPGGRVIGEASTQVTTVVGTE